VTDPVTAGTYSILKANFFSEKFPLPWRERVRVRGICKSNRQKTRLSMIEVQDLRTVWGRIFSETAKRTDLSKSDSSRMSPIFQSDRSKETARIGKE
jgi:hypothetical protein